MKGKGDYIMLELFLVLFVLATMLLGAGCTLFLICYSKRFRKYVREEIEIIEREMES